MHYLRLERTASRKNFLYALLAPDLLIFGLGLMILSAYFLIEGDVGRNTEAEQSFGLTACVTTTLAFCLGSLLARIKSKRLAVPVVQSLDLRIIDIAMVLVTMATVAWITRLVLATGGPAQFLMSLGSPIARDLKANISGVTTFMTMNTGIFAIIFVSRRAPHRVRIVGAALILSVIFRTYFNQERIAFLEIAIPYFLSRVCATPRGVVRSLVPILILVLFTVSVFIVSESTRSLAARGVTEPAEVLQAGTERFGLYYLTSLKNGFTFSTSFAGEIPFCYTFRWIWEFPLWRGIYEPLFGTQPIATDFLSEVNLDPEFNVYGAWTYICMDFGLIGALAACFIYGWASGKIYERSFQEPIFFGFYNFWIIGLFEYFRIYYITDVRTLAPMLVFSVSFYAVYRGKR